MIYLRFKCNTSTLKLTQIFVLRAIEECDRNITDYMSFYGSFRSKLQALQLKSRFLTILVDVNCKSCYPCICPCKINYIRSFITQAKSYLQESNYKQLLFLNTLNISILFSHSNMKGITVQSFLEICWQILRQILGGQTEVEVSSVYKSAYCISL